MSDEKHEAVGEGQPHAQELQPKPAVSAPCAATATGDTVGLQCELARLRRERDAAVAQEQALLRRARDAAVAEAEQARVQLERLAREHAQLQQAHAVAALQAEQQAAQHAAQLASSVRELERTQAAHAALAARNASKALSVEALETKVAVLIECFGAMEAEHQQAWMGRDRNAAAALDVPARQHLLSATNDGPFLRSPDAAEGSPLQSTAQVAASAAGPSHAQCLAPSDSRLSLALCCADLQSQLDLQQRKTTAARQAAAAAEEQAAGLRLLLARHQAAGGGTALLEERLGAACRQLDEARRLGAELQRQLAQARLQCTAGLTLKIHSKDVDGVPGKQKVACKHDPSWCLPLPVPCRRTMR